MALRLPRPLGGQCVKATVKKNCGFGGVARLRGYGPEAAKATERPMCTGSCKEKAVVLGGVSGLGGYRPEAAKATGRPMCKGSCKEKG